MFASTPIPPQLIADCRTIVQAFGTKADIDQNALRDGHLGEMRPDEDRYTWRDERFRVVCDASSLAVEIADCEGIFPLVAVGPEGNPEPSAALFHDMTDFVADCASHMREVASRAFTANDEQKDTEREKARPREYTADEVQESFLAHLREVISCWANLEGEHSVEDRVSGAVFSTLVTLDGGSGDQPGYTVSPSTDPGNVAWARANGMNWYAEGCDIGGGLHELLAYKSKSKASEPA